MKDFIVWHNAASQEERWVEAEKDGTVLFVPQGVYSGDGFYEEGGYFDDLPENRGSFIIQGVSPFFLSQNDIFARFIVYNMKGKMPASGWPSSNPDLVHLFDSITVD